MNSFRRIVLPLLIFTAVALDATGCARDNMTDNGKMMHDSGGMNKQDGGGKASNDQGTM